jgi:hypothetical protein
VAIPLGGAAVAGSWGGFVGSKPPTPTLTTAVVRTTPPKEGIFRRDTSLRINRRCKGPRALAVPIPPMEPTVFEVSLHRAPLPIHSLAEPLIGYLQKRRIA